MYAIESQLRWHGVDPREALLPVGPRPGEHTVHIDDLESAIRKKGDSVALVLLGGVQYYTGQLLDMERITAVRESEEIVESLPLQALVFSLHRLLKHLGLVSVIHLSWRCSEDNAGPIKQISRVGCTAIRAIDDYESRKLGAVYRERHLRTEISRAMQSLASNIRFLLSSDESDS